MLNNLDPTVAGATGEYSSMGQGKQVEREDDGLGKDAFLELLITQLSHQDPLDPMDNDEFVAQMAQFSSLEQMENMNSNLENFIEKQGISEGASLIGREVETVDSDSGEKVVGLVESVSREEGEFYLHLQGYEDKYPLEGITAVHAGDF